MGAELQSLVLLSKDQEYMWSGDPAFWGKKSPVLFPIVGGLKNNQYQCKGSTHSLCRHGFAREKKFTLLEATKTELVFGLRQDAETLARYPFDFSLKLRYTLVDNKLVCSYEVQNPGDSDLYFSIGAHPAFRVPIQDGDAFQDYQLQFSHTEQAPIWPLSPEGLLLTSPQTFTWNTAGSSSCIPLSKPLFYGDALVFKNLLSDTITLRHRTQEKGFHFRFNEFPFFGIWSAKDAPFVCLEPWCGIADSIDTTGELSQKEGIEKCAPGSVFTRQWEIEPF